MERTGTGSERNGRAFHGMTRAMLSNMVTGVTAGFSKKLGRPTPILQSECLLGMHLRERGVRL